MGDIVASMSQSLVPSTMNRLSVPLLGILFLGRKRSGFDPEWGLAVTEGVRRALDGSPLDWFEPDGTIYDDATLSRAVDDCRRAGANVLVALQTTMSDSRLARTLCQVWPDPVVLWATPEKPEGEMVSSCSLVGAHNWASNLYHHGRGFEIVCGDPSDPATVADLGVAARILFAARRMRGSGLGVIGGQAPGFFAMAPDANALHNSLGVQVQQFTLPEFFDAMPDLESAEVREDVEAIRALRLPFRETSEEDLPVAGRLYLAMCRFYDEHNLDALALRCWPELPNHTGQWPYLGMARLADRERGIAMEGDGDGALTALLGGLLGFGPCYLSDWLEHSAESITFWHAGNIPFALSPKVGAPGGPRLARHFNNKLPTVVESTLMPEMPVTVMRLWNRRSEYVVTAAEGTTRTPRRELMGSQGEVVMAGLSPGPWFDQLCHEGMPHHVAIFRGHHLDTVSRWARLSGVTFIG